MQIEADVGTIGDEDAAVDVDEAFICDGAQFLEEAGDVHYGAGANEVDAFRRDETGWEDVEVVGHGIMDDGMTGVLRAIGLDE